jgi:hypothetical protein
MIGPGGCSVKGVDFIKIAQMLCIDYPSEILQGILKLVDKKEEETIEFDEFMAGIKTIFLFDSKQLMTKLIRLL